MAGRRGRTYRPSPSARSSSTSARPAAPVSSARPTPPSQAGPRAAAPVPAASAAKPGTAQQPATTAQPAAGGTPVVVQQSGPGLFGQMASTAAGVAVGHTVGEGISRALFGPRGGAEHHDAPAAADGAAAPPQPSAPAAAAAGAMADGPIQGAEVCSFEKNQFADCIQSNGGNVGPCQHLFEVLRQCQDANSGPSF